MSKAADKIVYRSGLALDAHTAQLWDQLKRKFPNLILTQGVRSGVRASGGTHLGLGALDFYLNGHNWRDVLKYAFDIGFYGWYRSTARGGTSRRSRCIWKTHIHLGVRGRSGRARSLAAQEISWRGLRNGLSNNGPDFFTYRPKNYKSASKFNSVFGSLVLKVMQWNMPAPGVGVGSDLGNDAGRIKQAAKMVNSRDVHLIGWNELGRPRRTTDINKGDGGRPSVFGSALDAALGKKWHMVKPTTSYNENYISYDRTRLTVVKQYPDLILNAPNGSGNKHLTRVVFRHIHGYTFAVGVIHLPHQNTSAGAADRTAMSKQVWGSMAWLSAQHEDCLFLVLGDMNQHGRLAGFTDGKMKLAREWADKTVGILATFTTWKATTPSTRKTKSIDHIYWSKSWYVLVYRVLRYVKRGKYVQPRPSDHDATYSEARM